MIELLVVIAIIAILAAILFPVFAQAREKARSATDESNLKQNALAVMQYIQDYDETFPMSVPKLNGAWAFGSSFATPWDWRPSSTAGYEARKENWSNSIQPYLKSYDVYKDPSSQEYQIAGLASAYAAPVKHWADMSYTYNGDLNTYSDAGVVAPSSIILMFPAYGKAAVAGQASTFPTLDCPDSGSPCVYKPYSSSCESSGENGAMDDWYVPAIPYDDTTPQFSVYVHSGGQNYAYCDGHVKWHKHGGNIADDPYDAYTASGVPQDARWDGCHFVLFSPDYNGVPPTQ